MEVLVSVIVPVYNMEKYIIQCLQSITSQDYNNIEVICINDGSQDESKNLIENYARKDSRVRLINKRNNGVSSARNCGISNSNGKYLTFIDADDIISKDFISTLVTIMESGCQCGVVGIASFSEKFETSFSSGSTFVFENNQTVSTLLGEIGGYMANKIYITEIIKKNNLILDKNISVAEDMLFNYRYFQYCKQIGYNPGVKYLYRQHADSSVNCLSNPRWYDLLSVYELMFDSIGKNDINSTLIYRMLFTLYEARYRKKLSRESTYEIDIKIDKYNSYLSVLTLKEKMYIYAYRFFPRLVTKYRRRYLNKDKK